jgi:hypothetical protein
MAERRKIFIGSSTEAQGVARLVAKVIERAGMEPVLWETIFLPGPILLDGIEGLRSSIDGAILLATPDLVCDRPAQKQKFSAPVQNVIFEYGYLSGRLSRNRVAVCQFDGAEIPSDLQGLTVVKAGDYAEGKLSALESEAEATLRRWLDGLVPLAAGIPPMSRLHGYSGTWDVQNRFSLWHGLEVGASDRVTWDGKTLLRIGDDGKEGYGMQIGQLKVKLGQYKATWDVANEVVSATVDADGRLEMRVKVCARTLVAGSEMGTPPSDIMHEGLPSPLWKMVLERVPDEPRKLKGHHTFLVAGGPYSLATEYYTYAD